MRSFLTVGTGLVWDDNPDFAAQRAESFGPLVELQFGFLSETRRQHFALDGEITAQHGDVQDGAVELSYGVESAQTKLTADLHLHRQSAGSFVGTLKAGTQAEGLDVVELLPRGGAVTTAGGALTFATGLRRPVGFEGAVQRDSRRYSGVLPRDADRLVVRAAAVLQFSKTTKGRVELERTELSSSGAVRQDWAGEALGFGVTHQIDPRTTVSGALGFRQIKGSRMGGRFSSKGAEASFEVRRKRLDGAVFAAVQLRQQSLGRRATLRFGYEQNGPHSAVSVWAGVTKASGVGTDFIGGASYKLTGEDSALQVGLDRRVTLAPESDDTRITDRIGVAWEQRLTENGRLNLRADYLRTAASLADVERRGLRMQAVYRHDLRRDWGVKTGMTWRARQDGVGGRVKSRSVFLTFEKRLQVRH